MRTVGARGGMLPVLPVHRRYNHAIVVVGAGLGPGGRLKPGLVSRLETALRATRNSPSAAVVLSGGGRGVAPEADAMARWMLDRGVNPERIVVERASNNTRENAQLTVPVLAALQVKTVTLVSETFHLRRARTLFSMVMRQQGLGHVRLRPVAAPDRDRVGARRESPTPERDLRSQAREWRSAPRPDMHGSVRPRTAQAQGLAAALRRS